MTTYSLSLEQYGIDDTIEINYNNINQVVSVDGVQYKDILPSINPEYSDIIYSIITPVKKLIINWLLTNHEKVLLKMLDIFGIENIEKNILSIATNLKDNEPNYLINYFNYDSKKNEENLKSFINSYKNKTLIIGSIFLRSPKCSAGHNNAFIVDWNKKTIIRFEPLGYKSSLVGSFKNLTEFDIKDALLEHITDANTEHLNVEESTGLINLKDEIAMLKYYTTGTDRLCDIFCDMKSFKKLFTGTQPIHNKDCQVYGLYYILIMSINQHIVNEHIEPLLNIIHSNPDKINLFYLLIYNLFEDELKTAWRYLGKKSKNKMKKSKKNKHKKESKNPKKNKLSKHNSKIISKKKKKV